MLNVIQPMTLKGFRDFLPQQTVKRLYLIGKIREMFERYGFEPIETPALEYLETFTGNIGEDEKMFFKFEDQGGRKVALRYDQTVPSSRFVSQYKNELSFPFKRYQIQTVWRAEKPQKGRYREFLQCDADVFGLKNPQADAEVISLTIDLYKTLGFQDFVVKISDRALLKDVPYNVVVAIDKLSKIGKDGVITEIVKKGYTQKEAENYLKLCADIKPNETLNAIFSYLKSAGFSEKNYQFDPSIARSFSYSTGPIWEVVIPDSTGGSVLGGERYDQLIGRFQKEDIPGTGFAIGFDRTLEAMEELGLLPEMKTKTQVLVTVFSPELSEKSVQAASFFRNNSINTDLYLDFSAKLDKQFKYANKRGIPYVIIIGPEEAAKGTVKVKNMKTGEQTEQTRENLLKFLISN